MSHSTSQSIKTASQNYTRAEKLRINTLAYLAIGLIFGILLSISALHDYLFFGWLAVSTFIIFALMGIHFIGQKQIKRDQN